MLSNATQSARRYPNGLNFNTKSSCDKMPFFSDFDNGSPTFYKRLMFALPHKKMEVRRRRSESGDHMISGIV